MSILARHQKIFAKIAGYVRGRTGYTLEKEIGKIMFFTSTRQWEYNTLYDEDRFVFVGSVSNDFAKGIISAYSNKSCDPLFATIDLKPGFYYKPKNISFEEYPEIKNQTLVFLNFKTSENFSKFETMFDCDIEKYLTLTTESTPLKEFVYDTFDIHPYPALVRRNRSMIQEHLKEGGTLKYVTFKNSELHHVDVKLGHEFSDYLNKPEVFIAGCLGNGTENSCSEKILDYFFNSMTLPLIVGLIFYEKHAFVITDDIFSINEIADALFKIRNDEEKALTSMQVAIYCTNGVEIKKWKWEPPVKHDDFLLAGMLGLLKRKSEGEAEAEDSESQRKIPKL